MGKILVGITSWTEPTLIKSGRFYPATARTAEARLRYYASQFPIVEVDSTYYGMPDERMSSLWVARTPDNFIFDVKTFRLFTMHQTSPLVLPRDIREELPAETARKNTIYYRDLSQEIIDELWRRFERALLPLDSAGKLGVVLFQFPPWFFPGEQERQHIAHCQEMLPQYRLAVEFLHASWTNEKNSERTFNFLKERKLAYVCCDEPQGFNASVPFISEATSDIGLVRFRRNKAAWEKPGNGPASGRFDYLYSEDELKELAPKIKQLSTKTWVMHVLFNNCYEDKAVNHPRQTALLLE